MGSLKDRFTRAYIHNKTLRVLDPVIKRRGKIRDEFDRRAAKGKKTVTKKTSKVLYNPRARRKRR